MPKAEIRLGKACPFILDLFGTKRTVKAEVPAIPQREVAKRIYRSVLLDLGIDEMS
jgi:hypothetical protein